MQLMRTIFIWIFGLLGSGLFGSLIGGALDSGYSKDGNFFGFIGGLCLFACFRLWLGSTTPAKVDDGE